MSAFQILISELTLFAAAAFALIYFSRGKPRRAAPFRKLPAHKLENLLRLQSVCGYSPHSLVSISERSQVWFDYSTQSGLSFTECGKIRLVAGDLLATDGEMNDAIGKFLAETRSAMKFPAFLPASEKFARMIVPFGFEAIKIGASPHFDLQNWNPRGDKAKKMRAGVNRARREGISVLQVETIVPGLVAEIQDICENWLKTRQAKVSFSWLFELSPLRFADRKKFFTARDANGKLVGLLAASPIPARGGWYLEDILRYADSPPGTTDLMVYETLNTLAAEGALHATLGTVPLATDGINWFEDQKHVIVEKLLDFARANLGSFYNIKGLRHFKAKFVPSWWESEYLVLPSGFLMRPRVAGAFASAILPDGLISRILNRS